MSTRLAQMLWGSSAPPAPRRLEAGAGLPVRAGIELESGHCREVLDTRPDVGFFEVRAGNLMDNGDEFRNELDRIRKRYPLALRGGLSIGAQEPLDEARLDRLAALIARYEPASLSLPHDSQILAVCEHIDLVHERLQRRILLQTAVSDAGFLREVVARTGCGLALDITSARVVADGGRNLLAFVDDLPLDAVGEIRLAGLADEAVWAVYAHVIARTGPTPTVLARGNEPASVSSLLKQARRADNIMSKRVAPRTCGIFWGNS